MLELFDRQRQRVKILQNACGVTESRPINALWHLSFSLPYDDPKNDFCQPFWYVRYDGGELYRILPREGMVEDSGLVTYTCEHVLATLIDKIMFGWRQIGNIGTYTTDVIEYLLGQQSERNWVLAECDFARQFEYGWEQENLLAALFSVPQPFAEKYIWRTDTSAYPWRLSLKRLDEIQLPQLYIRRAKNLLRIRAMSDPQNVCTRLYPLGYGEGVNQLGISDVNDGVPYLESPPEIVSKYGIIERAWIDRRYENAESLKAAAQAMLKALQEPRVEYEVDFAQLSGGEMDRAETGKIVMIVDPETGVKTKTYITGMEINYEDVTQSTLTIANQPEDIASTVADLADRQRIEMTYSQGATQLYSQALQGNADTDSGLVMDFFIPDEMRIINKVMAKVRIGRFRAYSKATEGGGATATTTTSGGGTESTTRSGGGSSQTSGQSGGKTVLEETSQPSSESAERHVHNFWLPKHEHTVRIPSHSHDIDIPDHSHRLTLPSHDHEITPGIYFFGSPAGFTLWVNGQQRAAFTAATAEIDLTGYLTSAATGKITRGAWQSIEIRPDGLAYISIDMYVQGFVQGRGDVTV